MPVELGKKRLSRRIGALVVTITDAGIELRAPRKRRKLVVTWAQIAKVGLENDHYCLTEAEWRSPLAQLQKLRRLPQHNA